MNKLIKVGTTTFQMEVLQGITLTDAYNRFEYLRKDIVKHAHAIANPKGKPKKGSQK